MNKVVLLFIVGLLCGCNTEQAGTKQKAELEEQVMAVHDSAMADMDQVFRLRKKLRTLRDTLATRQADSATLQLLQQNITGLGKADESMMNWMRNYKAPDTLQHDQAMHYLQDELHKIERVKTIMDSTIKAAQTTYKQHEL